MLSGKRPRTTALDHRAVLFHSKPADECGVHAVGAGRRPQRPFHTRQQPASATGQGTKSRKVERRGCGWRYGDLSVRDVMMAVAPRHEAGRRRMVRMPIQAAEQPERGPRMAI